MAKIIENLVEYMLAARQAAKLPAEVVQARATLDSLAAIVSGSTLKPGQARAATCARAGRQGRMQRLGIKSEKRRPSLLPSPTACRAMPMRLTTRTVNCIQAARLFPPRWRWPSRKTEAGFLLRR